jgi:sensor histidine kinase YesM
MKVNWTAKHWVKILLHIVFWVVVFSLPTLLRPSHENHQGPPATSGTFYQYLTNCATYIGLFYLNAYFLIPRYFPRQKYSQYALALLMVFIILSFINWLSFTLLVPERQFRFGGFFFFYIFPCIFFLLCSTAFRMFNDKLTGDRRAKEKETENLKTELAFLRSQVSPHFMFNVLNNMVALARKKSDLLEPSLIKLSSLLRYMLYETDEERVLLEKEVDYLQSYIDLQMQRFGKKVQTNVCMSEVDASYFIEPMLLIPFVENAFKHGTGAVQDAEINIELKAKNNLLHFTVSNVYQKESTEIKDKTSGIGLQNVQRRLNLLYRNMHTLHICNKDNRYTVSLQIKLH